MLILSLTLTSCDQVKFSKYESIIDRVARVEIDFRNLDKKIELYKSKLEILKTFSKEILSLKLKGNFSLTYKIDLCEKEKLKARRTYNYCRGRDKPVCQF